MERLTMKQKKEWLRIQQNRINDAIKRNTNNDNLYSRGLASEGWNGGYRDAISDVILLFNGVIPNYRNFC
jgi:hypothetical protein